MSRLQECPARKTRKKKPAKSGLGKMAGKKPVTGKESVAQSGTEQQMLDECPGDCLPLGISKGAVG